MLELPAPASGALVEILKGDGATVAGQEVIAIIDTEAKAQRRRTVGARGCDDGGEAGRARCRTAPAPRGDCPRRAR